MNEKRNMSHAEWIIEGVIDGVAFAQEAESCSPEVRGMLMFLASKLLDAQAEIQVLVDSHENLQIFSQGVTGNIGQPNYSQAKLWKAFDPCPHCKDRSGYHVAPMWGSGAIMFGNNAVYTCKNCQWEWRVDDGGFITHLDDCVPF